MLFAEDVGVDLVTDFGWETAECRFCEAIIVIVAGGGIWDVIVCGSRSSDCWFYGLNS